MRAGVLFDVDGTLVDTSYLHTVAWWEALVASGHDVPMVRVHRGIGMGSDRILDFLLGPGRDRSGDGSLVTQHDENYGRYWDRLRPLPGARELVWACAKRALGVVLATSARPEELDAVRAALGVDEAIDAVTTASDAGRSKPAPDIIEQAMSEGGLARERTVLVGDTVWDIEAARAAGIGCIALTCGGVGADELHAAGPLAVYEDPADLLVHLDSVPLPIA